jgi:hypothetical protein
MNPANAAAIVATPQSSTGYIAGTPLWWVTVVATALRACCAYAFEKSAVFGMCEGGAPITIAICLRSVSSIARGSC